jgi:hypothetical protein
MEMRRNKVTYKKMKGKGGKRPSDKIDKKKKKKE